MKEPIIVYPDAPEHFDSILDEDRRARLGTIGKFSYFEVPATDADEFLGRIANARAIILGWGLPAGVIERATHLELISFTGIAQQVANFARALGMQVLVWTRRPQAPRAEVCDVQFVPLHTLLEASDVVSVHVAHTL